MRQLTVIVALLAATSIAHADAREDIVDIRNGSLPNHAEALGWTTDGAFVFRRTECIFMDLSDIPGCGVTVDVAFRGHTESHVLFGKDWEADCDEDESDDPSLTCWNISTAEAMKFIRAERDLLGRLGSLRKGPSGRTKLASGKLEVVGYDDKAGDRQRVAIALSRGGHWHALRVISSVGMDSGPFLRDDPTIDQVEVSPDGSSLAVVTTIPFQDTDFYFDTHGVSVVPNPDAPGP